VVINSIRGVKLPRNTRPAIKKIYDLSPNNTAKSARFADRTEFFTNLLEREEY